MKNAILFICLLGWISSGIGSAQTAGSPNSSSGIFARELMGGLTGGLISTAGLATSAVFVVLSSTEGPMAEKLGYGGLITGLVGMGISLISVPFVVAGGVNHSGKLFQEPGNYGYALIGSAIGTVAGFGLSYALFKKTEKVGFLLIGIPLSNLLLIPALSVLSYNMSRSDSQGSFGAIQIPLLRLMF